MSIFTDGTGRSMGNSKIRLVITLCCATACTGPVNLDQKPSEYWSVGGESQYDPAGAPQAASIQGHVANWWKCIIPAALLFNAHRAQPS